MHCCGLYALDHGTARRLSLEETTELFAANPPLKALYYQLLAEHT